MKATKSLILIPLVVGLTITALIGCGDSTRNDQGVSFTFYGWFMPEDDSQNSDGGTDCSIGVTRTYMPITWAETTETLGGTGALADIDPGGTLFAQIRNNLTQQAIRVERMVHEYNIPGASVQPPTTSVAFPFILAPTYTGEEGDTDFDSSLPPGFAVDGDSDSGGFGNIACAATTLVPAPVRSFIALNRQQMPEPPFVIIVKSTATGVTSAGQSISSNPIEFEIVILPDAVIAPTGGSAGEAEEDSLNEGGGVASSPGSEGEDSVVDETDFGDEL